MRRTWSVSSLIALGLAVLAFAARLGPVLRGGGLHGVLAYDDGVYFAASEAFAFGRLPYRDFVLLHPPGIVLVLSPFALLARAIADDSTALALARLAFMAVGAVNAVLVFRVARSRLGLAAGVAGGLFYAVWQPAVFAERTTLLEPWVNLGVLSSLLLLGDPRTASRRRLAMAGAALGLASAVKLWAVIPFLVLLCWVLVHRGRAAWRYLAGAAGAAALVCLPFFLAAPERMVRLVLLDQLSRSADSVGPWQRRLAGMTAAKSLDKALPLDATSLALTLLALMLLAAAVVARQVPPARPWCALFVAQSAVLMTSPSYFPHYATYAAPALALVVGATAHLARAALRRAADVWSPVAATAGVLVAVSLLVGSQQRAQGWVAPGPGARAALAAAGCVAADAPATLASADLLGHDLRRGCAVLVDPTGLVYDQPGGAQRVGSSWLARHDDVVWQQRMAAWFAESQAVLLQHGNPSALSGATMRALARGRTATSHQRYEVYVTRDLPPRASLAADGRRARGSLAR